MTGGVDSSIALQAGKGVQQPNPLETIGKFAGVQNALNSNKMFPLQQRALDLSNQRSQLGLQSDQSSLIQQQRQLGYASLAPLLAKKGPLTLDDLTTGLAGFEKSGGVSAPVLAEMMHLPLTGDPAADDANFRAHILANTQAPAAAAGAVLPGQATVDTGTGIQPVTVGARGLPGQGGLTPAGPQVEVYPSRGSTLQPVTWKDAHGVEQQGTMADWAHAHDMDSSIGPATTAGAAPGGKPAPIPGDGSYRPRGAGTQAPNSSGPIAGPVPGTAENTAASAMSAHSANQRASTFASDIFPLQQAQTALANGNTLFQRVARVSLPLGDVNAGRLPDIHPVPRKSQRRPGPHDPEGPIVYLSRDDAGPAGVIRRGEEVSDAGPVGRSGRHAQQRGAKRSRRSKPKHRDIARGCEVGS